MIRSCLVVVILYGCFGCFVVPENPSTVGQTIETTTLSEFGFPWTCKQYSTVELFDLMQGEEEYNPQYMAITLDEAAKNFPDLTDLIWLKRTTNEYYCDVRCQLKTELIKQKLQERGESVLDETTVLGVERIDSVDNSERASWDLWTSSGQTSRPSNFDGVGTEKRSTRAKRQTSTANEIGQSYKINCKKQGQEFSELVNLCGSCRGIRELTENFFPRFINEAICENTECLGGHGRCVQKMLNFDILKNEGSTQCQLWVPFTIKVPVCCDCMMSSDSKFATFARNS